MPETLVSDNGTQFTSAEFAEFCCANGIQHITTALFHPQSNGQVERFVDTFKRATKKIREGKGSMQEALDLFLLTYRSTPNPSAPNGASPAEAMFGRQIRTNLELLRPPSKRHQEEVGEESANRRSIQPNDQVYVKLYSKNIWSWVPGTILERIGKVMYNVWTEKRNLVRSHVNQLRPRTSTDFECTSESIKPRNPLPLDVLLSAWNFKEPSKSASSVSTNTPRPNAIGMMGVPSLSPPPEDTTHHPVVSNHTRQASTVASNIESSSSSTSMVQQPRRSSRIRRMPARFDVYRQF